MGEDGNVLSFLYMNRDKKNIRVEYLGERKFSTTMTPSDREALVGTYELAKLLSSIRQIQQEKEEANLKIEFVKRKMEQKAQEEAAENKDNKAPQLSVSPRINGSHKYSSQAIVFICPIRQSVVNSFRPIYFYPLRKGRPDYSPLSCRYQ